MLRKRIETASVKTVHRQLYRESFPMIDSRLAELQKITQQQFALLCAEFPELKHRGLTLFLGSHYAHPDSGILMLGLNPGQDKPLPEDYGLQRRNCLLGDPADQEAKAFVYWRNARRCFEPVLNCRKGWRQPPFRSASPFGRPISMYAENSA